MDVDQVHDMMDEIAEQQEVAKEIGKFIFNSLKDLKEITTKLSQKITLAQLFLERRILFFLLGTHNTYF